MHTHTHTREHTHAQAHTHTHAYTGSYIFMAISLPPEAYPGQNRKSQSQAGQMRQGTGNLKPPLLSTASHPILPPQAGAQLSRFFQRRGPPPRELTGLSHGVTASNPALYKSPDSPHPQPLTSIVNPPLRFSDFPALAVGNLQSQTRSWP